jgi:hypothetical protein
MMGAERFICSPLGTFSIRERGPQAMAREFADILGIPLSRYIFVGTDIFENVELAIHVCALAFVANAEGEVYGSRG